MNSATSRSIASVATEASSPGFSTTLRSNTLAISNGVTPILTDLPPDETLSRPDGEHSGNPDVRRAIANGEPQHVAWAYERADGHRGFGFTSGHFHWNWGNDEFRKVVLNAIVWAAHGEVPEGGVSDKSVTDDELLANQDEPKPDGFAVPRR